MFPFFVWDAVVFDTFPKYTFHPWRFPEVAAVFVLDLQSELSLPVLAHFLRIVARLVLMISLLQNDILGCISYKSCR